MSEESWEQYLRRFINQSHTNDLKTKTKTDGYPPEWRGFSVKVSFGQGNRARVPWIAFLGHGMKPSRGIYPVYLYYRDFGRLILAYGVSEENEPQIRWPNNITNLQPRVSDRLRMAPRYGNSYVFRDYTVKRNNGEIRLFYSGSDEEATADTINRDLSEILNIYSQVLNNMEDSAQESNQESRPQIPHNIILYGPVGTGKTSLAHVIARMIVSDDGIRSREELLKLVNGDLVDKINEASARNDQIKVITFHPSYGYEEFIEGITARTENNQIVYKLDDGVFKKLCKEAINTPNKRYVLIIDEINRGNIPRVFGELITTIEEEKRCSNNNDGYHVTLPHSGDDFCVPKNLYIIGTMNTTDRSIALLDVAIRRRFVFINVPPSPELVEKWAKSGDQENDDFPGTLRKAFEKINEEISKYKGPDYQIGHSFFFELSLINSRDEKIKTTSWIFRYKIIPLLEEIFYGNLDLLKNVIPNFIDKVGEESNYIVWNEKLFEPDKFLDTLETYAGKKTALTEKQ